MSEFNFQKYALMCMRLAAECRGLAAVVTEPDLGRTSSVWPAGGRNWRINPVSCINA